MRERCQPACKPGSVRPENISDAAAIPLGRPLPAASSNQPGRRTGNRPGALTDAMPPLFGFAPGGVCPAVRVTASAVRSYRTLSPLPRRHFGLTVAVSERAEVQAGRSAFCGTVPGVAPAGRYPAPCFHGARTFLSGFAPGAAARPTDTPDLCSTAGRVKSIWSHMSQNERPLSPAG